MTSVGSEETKNYALRSGSGSYRIMLSIHSMSLTSTVCVCFESPYSKYLDADGDTKVVADPGIYCLANHILFIKDSLFA